MIAWCPDTILTGKFANIAAALLYIVQLLTVVCLPPGFLNHW